MATPHCTVRVVLKQTAKLIFIVTIRSRYSVSVANTLVNHTTIYHNLMVPHKYRCADNTGRPATPADCIKRRSYDYTHQLNLNDHYLWYIWQQYRTSRGWACATSRRQRVSTTCYTCALENIYRRQHAHSKHSAMQSGTSCDNYTWQGWVLGKECSRVKKMLLNTFTLT